MAPGLEPLSPSIIATLPDNSNLPLANRKETIIGVALTFLSIALLAVTLRIYVRVRGKIWGWDDFFVLLAAIGCTAGSILICQMPDDGLGKQWWTLSQEQQMMFFKHIWATNITYAFSTTCVKLAILIQYLRLFDNELPNIRKLILGLVGLISMWGVTFTFLALFSCSPISSFWRFTQAGKCVGWGSKDPNVFFATFVGHAASNMVLDIIVLSLPITFFGHLRMSGKTRFGLITLFGMGGIAVTLAIARVVSLSLKKGGTVPVFNITHSTPTVYIFSVLEINVAIICASIPIFWPLVTSLTSNKIFIVNEIEIRSERRSEHIDLMDVDKANDFTAIGEIDGRNSRSSVLASGHPDTSSSRIARSLSRRHHTHHHQKHSSSSSKEISLALRPTHSRRSEEDSKSLVHKVSERSFNSTNTNKNPLADLENPNDNTHARYKDKYSQFYAVPDFDQVPSPSPTAGAFRRTDATRGTSGSPPQEPFDHIGALKK
ncbi:hypothetical protein DM02DRAFT_615956 [Periconia macrospinosa]|uniref:Rhodopsin domain-containing protein n=1 Tax=Periconia macrospinosa TaxID=97972 RepID=A0A2V1DJE5_9PLEO|nr:hypothetical protein DM02DRAFT_615956 [Periconia macrospinosa]